MPFQKDTVAFWGGITPVAYAENFHGGFIQWHMVAICI